MGLHHGHILRLLRDEGPLSRADLARRSGLSSTTLTHISAQLIRDGSIREVAGSESARIGRPAQSIGLVADAHYVAGVHIGAINGQAVITDVTTQEMTRRSFDYNLDDPDHIISKACQTVTELSSELKLDARRLIGIGIGVPCAVDANRRVALESTIVKWRNIGFADQVEAKLRRPAIVEHNVSAMALAESRYGVGKAASSLLYVYLRTGLGAGLIVDGTAFRPGGQGAVELGHIQVAADGPPCACGNSGCLETFVCESALMRMIGLAGVAPTDLLARVEAKPEAWELIVRHLTNALATAVNLLAPDLIVFGGHLGEAPDTLFARLQAEVFPRIAGHLRGRLNFARASFGTQAGAIGGAAAALDQFFYSGALH